MKRLFLLFFCLLLLSLTGCRAIGGAVNRVFEEIIAPSGVTIDGVAYRSGFYGDMNPVFGQVGDIGSETLQEEIAYSDGERQYRRVDFAGHDWVHSYVGGTTGGTVYCAEDEWEEARDYYADPAHFTYYGIGEELSADEIAPQKFEEIFAFAEESDYEPFGYNDENLGKTFRLPEEAFRENVGFSKVSDDGYFTIGTGSKFFVHEGELLFAFYHDGGRTGGGVREVVAMDVPEELEAYVFELMERYP